MTASVPIEPAATLILVREGPDGIEILMQQRNPQAVFVGGAWVFPGGKLDPNDNADLWQSLIVDLSESDAYRTLDLAHAASPCNADEVLPHEAAAPLQAKALAYWVAALREAFEEAGLLLVKERVTQTQRDHWREQLLSGALSWQQLIESNNLSPAVNQLHYLSRWVTPPHNTRRYDTRFFITQAPMDQDLSHEDYEAIETRWLRPQDALSAAKNGEMQLILPTLVTVRALSEATERFASADAVINNVLEYFNPQR